MHMVEEKPNHVTSVKILSLLMEEVGCRLGESTVEIGSVGQIDQRVDLLDEWVEEMKSRPVGSTRLTKDRDDLGIDRFGGRL